MVSLAEQVVAHLSPSHQVERLRVSPESQNLKHIYFPRDVFVLRQALGPAVAPFCSKNAFHFCAETFFNGSNGGLDIVVIIQCLHMLIEVAWFSGTAAQSVNFRTGET